MEFSRFDCHQELARANEALDNPALLVPSGDELVQLEQASANAAEVTSTVLKQKMELEEKKRNVTILQKALVSSAKFCFAVHTCFVLSLLETSTHKAAVERVV